ncbi:Kv channel-interacting protein 2-like [Belonocnema kinseyi]|uniref:Kv channel-interacting protein 2-like n=1 Tax=Belonocnema kinseyi TaxID=2817044 RepID=UPI00143E07EF|nr:Kv channel-interacting protein 2-like [Belonocnema kinseyi]
MQDEVQHNFTHIIPERLESLECKTGFSRHVIRRFYRAFKQHCPGGAVTTNNLRPVYAKLFPLGDSRKYAQIVFNTFDEDKDGLITFGDLLSGIASIVKGDTDKKLSWIFGLYDLNGDGHITRHEMLAIVSAIYEMVEDTRSIERAVHRHVNRIFEKMDLDRDGIISKEEFITSCKNDQLFCNQLTIFDDLWW